MRGKRDISVLMKQANRLAEQIEKKMARKRKIDARIKAIQNKCDHHPEVQKNGQIYCVKCGADLTPPIKVSDAAKKGLEAIGAMGKTPDTPNPTPPPKAPEAPTNDNGEGGDKVAEPQPSRSD
jgi:hypothetical protein